MVHPHPNYSISPAESFHSAGGRLAYGHGGLTQLMQMNRVPASDLGPPLFMPGEQNDSRLYHLPLTMASYLPWLSQATTVVLWPLGEAREK